MKRRSPFHEPFVCRNKDYVRQAASAADCAELYPLRLHPSDGSVFPISVNFQYRASAGSLILRSPCSRSSGRWSHEASYRSSPPDCSACSRPSPRTSSPVWTDTAAESGSAHCCLQKKPAEDGTRYCPPRQSTHPHFPSWMPFQLLPDPCQVIIRHVRK